MAEAFCDPSAVIASLRLLWKGRERFVVLCSEFAGGEYFLAIWEAWRNDPARCDRLHVVCLAAEPPSRDQLLATLPATQGSTQLIGAWPPLTPNLHRLSFEQARVQLLLAVGTAQTWLPELSMRFDALWLTPTPQQWPDRAVRSLARLSAPGAAIFGSPWSQEAAAAFPIKLRSAGFQLGPSDLPGDVSRARYAPEFLPRRGAQRPTHAASLRRHALIIGAGLAGAATAWALAEQGWKTTLLDRQHAPALETSGNPAGLFHGIVNPEDGHHARFNRAAALEVRRAVDHAVRSHGVAGHPHGLIRLEKAGAELAAMTAMLQRLRLPGDYVQALSAQQASAVCGLPLTRPAWFYAGGGWVSPSGLVKSYLSRAGTHVTFRGAASVERLCRGGSGWQVLDADGHLIDESEVLVLANAGDALRLLGQPDWPVTTVRGQLSTLAASDFGPLPSVPLAGPGYLLPEINGRAIFGATAQVGDPDPNVRDSDHALNLEQLRRLTGSACAFAPEALQGRTGWRCVSDDRLPLIGAAPNLAAQLSHSWDQPRKVPRLPGLYLFAGLGSRGITWSALGAQALASAITGAPSPLECSLLDAIDPARFLSRRVRRTAASRG